MSVESIAVEYIHDQTKKKIPINLSELANLISSQGIEFQKNKTNKNLLISLYNQYNELYDYIQHSSNFDQIMTHKFSFPIDPFLSILPDMLNQNKNHIKNLNEEIKKQETIPIKEQNINLESDKELINEEQSIESDEETNLNETQPVELESDEELINEEINTNKKEEEINLNEEQPIELETVKEELRFDEEAVKEKEIENLESQSVEKHKDYNLLYNIYKNSPIKDINNKQLYYGIDINIAQYKETAKNIRTTILTYTDLYKDHKMLSSIINFVKRAIKLLIEKHAEYDHQEGFIFSEKVNINLPRSNDHIRTCYNILIEYYQMLLNILNMIEDNEFLSTQDENNREIYMKLQTHLSTIRTMLPYEIEQYRDYISKTDSVSIKNVSNDKKISYNISPNKVDLSYYAILASYSTNPKIVLEDPMLEQLCTMFSISDFSTFINMYPEQRLQFIQLVYNITPFDQVIKDNISKEHSIPVLLKKYIEDNIEEKGCESLRTHFNTELQSIQSDLKHYIMLYGEDPKQSIIEKIELKYNCKLNEEQMIQIQIMLDQGLEGQLSILNQIYKHYPSVVKISVLENMIHILSEKQTETNVMIPGVMLELEESNKNVLDMIPESKQHIKIKLLSLRDFFNNGDNRYKLYNTLELLKKRHVDLSNRDMNHLYKETIIELYPDPEDPLRLFLLNFIDLYGSLDKITFNKNNNILQLSHLRHLPSFIQQDIINNASLFLLGSSLRLEKNAYYNLRDRMILNCIEFLLYSQEKKESVLYIEQQVNNLTLQTSFEEYKKDIESLKSNFIKSVKEHRFNDAISMLCLFYKITSVKILRDPLQSSTQFREQRINKKNLSDKILSRLPPLPTYEKEVMLWYIVKPWIEGINHTEYRNFEYFISLPNNQTKESMSPSISKLLGSKLSSSDLGFTEDVNIYRPTLAWWSYIIDKYHSKDPANIDVNKMIEELTLNGEDNQQFVMGIFSPGFAARIFTSLDYKKEYKWFQSHYTPSQVQFIKWANQPVSSIKLFLRPYLEKLILKLFITTISNSSKQEERIQLKVNAFINALFYDEKRLVGDVLYSFFLVYTFLSPKSIVYGYARSILDVFIKAPSTWYPYLLHYSIIELFPEITLVEPSVKEEIKKLIKKYIKDQIKQLFVESHPNILEIDISSNTSNILSYYLQNKVRPYVQTKWCPIDKSIAWYLTKDEEVACVHIDELETDMIPTNIMQSIREQLSNSELSQDDTILSEDFTIDTDIEMTAIKNFTAIIRDQYIHIGEYNSTNLALNIIKSHPNPMTGKSLSIEPIRDKLQAIAISHYNSLLKKLISQYVDQHPELFFQFSKEKENRYRYYAHLGNDLSIAENDFSGRKNLLKPLFSSVMKEFELPKCDEDFITLLVCHKMSDMMIFNNLKINEEKLLPELCGLCHKETDKNRLSYFYINGISEPEFFCSLECADKRMSKFQDEPKDHIIDLKGDKELFSSLLQYYPTHGTIDHVNDLYIPDKEILLQNEESLRLAATTINELLSIESDLVIIYKGVVDRYHNLYQNIINKKTKKVDSLLLTNTCDISIIQVNNFIKQYSSKFYDNLINGTFSFINTVMNDFYILFPVCDQIPKEIIHMAKQYKIIKRLSMDIERAYRLMIIPSVSKLMERLIQIYKWRYLNEIKQNYPYISDSDQFAKLKELLDSSSPSTDINICLELINNYAPIGQKINNINDFLTEINTIQPKFTGRNRLLKLLNKHNIDIKPDMSRYMKGITLINQIAKIFPEQFKYEIINQRINIKDSNKLNEQIKLINTIIQKELNLL
jgi:hypothetical protein